MSVPPFTHQQPTRRRCCWISSRTAQGCSSSAEWEIHDPDDRDPYSFTDACTRHVGLLFGAALDGSGKPVSEGAEFHCFRIASGGTQEVGPASKDRVTALSDQEFIQDQREHWLLVDLGTDRTEGIPRLLDIIERRERAEAEVIPLAVYWDHRCLPEGGQALRCSCGWRTEQDVPLGVVDTCTPGFSAHLVDEARKYREARP